MNKYLVRLDISDFTAEVEVILELIRSLLCILLFGRQLRSILWFGSWLALNAYVLDTAATKDHA